MPSVAKRTRPDRPKKPYPDFPLFPHATGRWAKKIKGRFAFFGPWGDPEGALRRYLDQRDDLFAGRVPRPRGAAVAAAGGTAPPAGGPTATLALRDLVNHFLTAKKRRLDAGEMSARAFSDYHATCRRLVQGLGPHRLVDDITSADFGTHRASLARTLGPVALGNEIGRVRSVFKYGYEAGLLDRPVRYGPEFVKPGRRAIRLARRAQEPKMFEAEEIRRLLGAAPAPLEAMIWLGINAGLGNADLGQLPFSALDLDKGILDYPRPKTGIRRRAVLWPETVAAIRRAIVERPTPSAEEDADVVFITKYGRRWVRVAPPGRRSKGRSQAVVTDAVGLQFGKLVREQGLHRPGRSFYSLRHTFRTVADEVGDRRAVDLVMGHEDGSDIATHYVERIHDARLGRVAEHVRDWLAPGSGVREPS